MEPAYLCNIDKNTECLKTECVKNDGPCFATLNPKFAWRDVHGDPILAFDNNIEATVFCDKKKGMTTYDNR